MGVLYPFYEFFQKVPNTLSTMNKLICTCVLLACLFQYATADPCQTWFGNPCFSGTCTATGGNEFTCQCPPEWKGDQCNELADGRDIPRNLFKILAALQTKWSFKVLKKATKKFA